MARQQHSPVRVCCVVVLRLAVVPYSVFAQPADQSAARDLVAVGIVDHGKAIVLATPGLSHRGRIWRFRSLDTSEIPQPIHDVVLSAGATKLFVQHGAGAGAVLDLTRQRRHNAPLQYIAPEDLVADGTRSVHSHRLPRQRFVSIRDGNAYVIDDVGAVQPEYPVVTATRGGISDDGAAVYVRKDRSILICGETESGRGDCRQLPKNLDAPAIALSARSILSGSK